MAENVGSRKKRHQLGTGKAVRPPGRNQPVHLLSPLFGVGSGSGIECGKGPVVINQNCLLDTQKFRTECFPHGVACPQGPRSAWLPLPASRCGPRSCGPVPGHCPRPSLSPVKQNNPGRVVVQVRYPAKSRFRGDPSHGSPCEALPAS